MVALICIISLALVLMCVDFSRSSDIANWLADFDVSMIPYSYCKSTGCM